MKIKITAGTTLETNSVWLDEEDNTKIHFIDQRYIPFKVEILTSTSPTMTADFIRKMVVRGAPAIGGTAAYGLVQSVAMHKKDQDKKSKILKDAQLLLESRPTAVDLKNSIDYMLSVIETSIQKDKDTLLMKVKQAAEKIVDSIIQECQQLAETGSQLIHNDMNIVHHCNTGPLATLDIGSALGIIIGAHSKGKKIHVYVDETRPRLQGGRLTTWELAQAGVPHTLIVDTVSATLMKQGKIDLILVGADRIAMNGDFANKIGTYNLAILANYHKVPMYTVAPWTTFDQTKKTGEDIVIEERASQEVTHAFSDDLTMKQISMQSKVYNPAFDVTPNELLTGIVAPGVLIKPPFTENIKQALQNVKKESTV